MKKLTKNESIGVFVAIVVTGFILFGGQFINLFMQDSANQANTAQAVQTGVRVENIVNGEGLLAEKGDTITVNYVGMLTDGKVFDSSVDRKTPFVFQLGVGQVIRGWDEGVMGMRIGGKRRLIIGPDYGYGSQTVGTIPPDSTLVFDVELLGVQKPKTK